MKKIIKSRIGKCLISDTDEIRYQLQFKAEGDSLYNGFSVDTFETKQDANEALESHIEGKRVYKAFASLGEMRKYYLCKVY